MPFFRSATVLLLALVGAAGDSHCVMWRQTGGCDAEGPRIPTSDKSCDEYITYGSSGFCECGDGVTASAVGCAHATFRCSDECKFADAAGEEGATAEDGSGGGGEGEGEGEGETGEAARGGGEGGGEGETDEAAAAALDEAARRQAAEAAEVAEAAEAERQQAESERRQAEAGKAARRQAELNKMEPQDQAPAEDESDGLSLPAEDAELVFDETGPTEDEVRRLEEETKKEAEAEQTWTEKAEWDPCGSPRFTAGSGKYAITVELHVFTINQPDTTIRYTTDGSEPWRGSPVWTEKVDWTNLGNTTIKAMTVPNEGIELRSSPVVTMWFHVVPQATAPVWRPHAGKFSDEVSIAVSSTSSGTRIHWTRDGSVPTEKSPVWVDQLWTEIGNFTLKVG
jgi:hypothetical protein